MIPAIGSNNNVTSGTADIGQGFRYLSPDMMLDYVQSQLQGIDSDVDAQMAQQQQALRQRKAIEVVQNAAEKFGTAGPQNKDEMKEVYDAYNNAIASLPENDPARAQLVAARDDMTRTYDYHAPEALSPEETQTRKDAQDYLDGHGAQIMFNTPGAADAYRANQQNTVDTLNAKEGGSLGHVPDKDHQQWQGETDKLKNISGDIKGQSDIDLMTLQDDIAKRQRVLTAATSIMSKLDETSLALAHNTGG